MITVPTRAILVAGCVLFVACGVLAGAAAADDHGGADDEWTVGFEGEVDVADNGGGDGGFTCTGMPTDHDCEKGSDFYAGPLTVEYDGYNRGSLDGGSYEFEDRFVVTDEDGQGAVVAVPCEFEDDAPEDNPCPASADEYDGSGQDGDGDDDRGDGGDGDGDPDASDDRRDNGDDGGNANDGDNASDEREEDDDSDDSEAPVDVDADVTVDPPSDGPGL